MRFLVTLVLLFQIESAFATCSVVQKQTSSTSGAGGATTVTATFSAGVTSGNTVYGMVSWDFGGAPPLVSITDDKLNVYTTLDTVLQSTDTQDNAQFILGNITNAPTVITVSWGVHGPASRTIAIMELSGIVASANPVDNSGSSHTGQQQTPAASGANGISSGATTSTTNNDCVVGSTYNNSGTITAGTGYTLDTSVTSPQNTQLEHLNQSIAGSTTATFTGTGSSNAVAFVAALKTSGGGATVIPPHNLPLLGAGQ